jgi:hypothetical protein
MVVAFLTWNYLRDSYSSLSDQKNETLAIYAFLGMATLVILTSILRVIFEIKRAATGSATFDQINNNDKDKELCNQEKP